MLATRTIVAVVTTDLETAPEVFCTKFRGEVTVSERPKQDCVAVVHSIAWLALHLITMFGEVVVILDPDLTLRVHAVWLSTNRRGLGGMTNCTRSQGPMLTLESKRLQVVVDVAVREDGVGCTVTSLALEVAVTFPESEQEKTWGGGVHVGGEGLVDCLA